MKPKATSCQVAISSIIIILIISVVGSPARAQIGKLLKEKKNKVLKAVTDPKSFAKEESINLLKKNKAQMDSASFGYAIALSDNAGLYENAETLDKVRDGFLLAFDNSEKEVSDVGTDYNDAGEMLYAGNKYRSAELSFLAAKYAFESEGLTTHIGYMAVIANLGLVNHTMGRYSRAREFTSAALEARKEVLGDKSDAYAASLNNLSVLEKDMGQYTQAEIHINQAIGITETNDDPLPLAILLNNKAMLMQSLGRYGEAEVLLEKSLKISEEEQSSKSNNHQRLMTNKAILYQEMERFEEAETLFLEVIGLKESRLGKSHPDYAHTLTNLASLYVQMGKDEEVVRLLSQAQEIYEDKFGKAHPTYATNLSHLGNFYRHKGQYELAEPLLKESLSIRKESLGEKHPNIASSTHDIALLYWESGRTEEAAKEFENSLDLSLEFIEEFFPAMSEAEKTKYWSKLQPAFHHFFSFASEAYKNQNEVATQLFRYRLGTRSLLLNSSLVMRSIILEGSNNQLKEDFLHWVDLKESLAGYYTYSKEELLDQKVNLDSLEVAANSLERSLSEKSEAFKSGYFQKTPQLQDFKMALAETEVLIDILQVPEYERGQMGAFGYFAMLVDKDSAHPILIDLGSSRELDDRYFKYYRNAIRLKTDDQYSYNKFFEPVEKHLEGVRHIYLSKDGIYHQINFTTLRKGQMYLLDAYDLTLLTSPREFLALKNTRESGISMTDIYLFGNPEYGASPEIKPLPGTLEEVGRIRQIVGTSSKVHLLTGAEATEESLKTAVEPSIIHLATHGFFLPDKDLNAKADHVFGIEPSSARENPMLRSGVMLKGAADTFHGMNTKELDKQNNGVLTAYEAANLNLRSTELVVLSACETGLGDQKAGEGVYGLQRAFLLAGANKIIMSLWKVDDVATSQLMTSFYKNLVTSKRPLEAFRKAQRELKKSYPEPYYWGAFVLIE